MSSANRAIERWLYSFRLAWTDKDFDAIRELFAEGVEYWETPFRKLEGVAAVLDEWQAIRQQSEIMIDTEVVTVSGDFYTVKWDLAYRISDETHHWAGVYLIKLHRTGKCEYFYQVGERQL